MVLSTRGGGCHHQASRTHRGVRQLQPPGTSPGSLAPLGARSPCPTAPHPSCPAQLQEHLLQQCWSRSRGHCVLRHLGHQNSRTHSTEGQAPGVTCAQPPQAGRPLPLLRAGSCLLLWLRAAWCPDVGLSNRPRVQSPSGVGSVPQGPHPRSPRGPPSLRPAGQGKASRWAQLRPEHGGCTALTASQHVHKGGAWRWW